jgi:hypothetical protein
MYSFRNPDNRNKSFFFSFLSVDDISIPDMCGGVKEKVAQNSGFFELKICSICLLTKSAAVWYNGISARTGGSRPIEKRVAIAALCHLLLKNQTQQNYHRKDSNAELP